MILLSEVKIVKEDAISKVTANAAAAALNLFLSLLPFVPAVLVLIVRPP